MSTITAMDLVAVTLCFLASFWLQRICFTDNNASLFSHVAILPLIIALLLVTLPHFGAYQSLRTASYFSFSMAVVKAMVTTIAILLGLLFFLKVYYISRFVIFVFAVFATTALVIIRCVVLKRFRVNLKHKSDTIKTLIIGTGERALSLSRSLRDKAEWGVEIVGYLDPDPAKIGQRVNGGMVLGSVHDISVILKDNVVDEVILAIPRTMLEDVEEIAYACQEEGIKLRLMADIFSLKISRMSLTELGNIPLLTLEPVAQDLTKLVVKRIFDIVVTVTLLPLFLPFFAIVATAIKLDSKGPVFFVQERVGLRKRTFKMYKFRSMYEDAEERLKEIEHLNEAEGPIFKIKNDPRVTRVGRFIRATSIDELPQLFNVLKGDMSLVGPRPMSLRDVSLFDKGIQRKRFSVKPGITCLWQISGRSNLPFDKWLELDLQYIENWSLSLDLLILMKTIPAVFLQKGAA